MSPTVSGLNLSQRIKLHHDLTYHTNRFKVQAQGVILRIKEHQGRKQSPQTGLHGNNIMTGVHICIHMESILKHSHLNHTGVV